MIKKRDKKKFIRRNIKLKNVDVDNIESFYESDIIEEKRAQKKLYKKVEISQKSGLKLEKGRILEVRSNYKCVVNISNEQLMCTLSGRLKQLNLETRNIISVGDFVNVDVSKLPRIEEILPRRNSLSRYLDDRLQTEIVIAANIDQVVITASFKEPDLSLGLIDRYICAAGIFNIIPVICINKIDLVKNLKELKFELKFYKEYKYKIIYTSVKLRKGMKALKKILINRDTVFSGHSGAGKTSLLNILQPDLNLKVAEISDSTRKGIHTTISGKFIAWDFGGYLVDTPGIKTFGLHKKDKYLIPKVFPGFSELYEECKFQNCTHTHEKDCAIKISVENGKYPEERYYSYIRIMESL